jgi:general secretion pathway protein G
MRRRQRERSVFLPWERRGSIGRRLGFNRARPVLAVAAVVAFMLLLGSRERTRAGVRSTRATLWSVRIAVDAFRADHDKACPPSFAQLQTEGYLGTTEPVDAWGRPLRLVCPGRTEPTGYDLTSDGPDGVPGGLDRVE